MKQTERFVTLALVLSLVAIPAIASAQGGGSGGSSTGGGIGAGPTATPEGGRGWDYEREIYGSSKDRSSMGSGKSQPGTTMTPVSANDCKNNGYRAGGFKTEAECLTEVKQ